MSHLWFRCFGGGSQARLIQPLHLPISTSGLALSGRLDPTWSKSIPQCAKNGQSWLPVPISPCMLVQLFKFGARQLPSRSGRKIATILPLKGLYDPVPVMPVAGVKQ